MIKLALPHEAIALLYVLVSPLADEYRRDVSARAYDGRGISPKTQQAHDMVVGTQEYLGTILSTYAAGPDTDTVTGNDEANFCDCELSLMIQGLAVLARHYPHRASDADATARKLQAAIGMVPVGLAN